MTYRERREARATRRREWAESRRRKAEAAYSAGHAIADAIPFGQPILVGHHSEAHARRDQARIESSMRQTYEHTEMAERHEQAATSIEAQLDRSIYDDDPDAAERLRERLADLEAQRKGIKAYNASCRKGRPDESLMHQAQRAEIATLRRIDFLRGDGGFGTYALSNLSQKIARYRGRLARLCRAAV